MDELLTFSALFAAIVLVGMAVAYIFIGLVTLIGGWTILVLAAAVVTLVLLAQRGR